MIWIILLSLTILYLLWKRISDNYDYSDVSPLIPAAVCIIVLIVFIYIPMYTPRHYEAQREKIISLRKGVDEIRASIYESSGKREMFDAKNMSQSKVLSEYTADVIKLEAEYNSELKSDQLAMKSTSSFWFGNGSLIPEEIMELKPL